MQLTGNKPLHFDAVTEQLELMLQLCDSINKHTVMQALFGIVTARAVGGEACDYKHMHTPRA